MISTIILIIIILLLIYYLQKSVAKIGVISENHYNKVNDISTEHYVISELLKKQIPPFKLDNVIYLDVNKDNVNNKVDQAINDGVQVFIGTMTSGLLNTLKPTINKYKDIAFLSTVSTAPSLNKQDNIFRLANNDATTIKYIQEFLSKFTYEHLFIYYDSDDLWSQELNNLLSSSDKYVKSIKLVDGYKVETIPDSMNLVFTMDHDKFLNKITPLNNNYYLFGDVTALQKIKSELQDKLKNTNIYAYTTYHHSLEHSKLINKIVGYQTSPFLIELLTALYLAVDAINSGKTTQEYLIDNYGIKNMNMFDINGDIQDVNLMFVKLNQEQNHDQWSYVYQYGNRKDIGDLYTEITQKK